MKRPHARSAGRARERLGKMTTRFPGNPGTCGESRLRPTREARYATGQVLWAADGVPRGRADEAPLCEPPVSSGCGNRRVQESAVTERKPLGMRFETWIDRQIRTAQERGEFDGLEGTGKPLPGAGKPLDEMWWVKGYLDREGLSGEALLPTPLQLRKEIERLPAQVRELPTEQAVRETVGELNRRIVAWLRDPAGPRVPISTVPVEDVVGRWRTEHVPHRGPVPARAAPSSPGSPVPQDTRWRRFVRLLRGR